MGKALDLAMASFAADRENLISVGPGAITEAVKGRTAVLVLPPQSFYAAGHVANPAQVEGQFAGDPWVYVVHWGHGTWKAEHPWKPEHERRPRTLLANLDERRQRQLALAQERLAARQRQREERIRNRVTAS